MPYLIPAIDLRNAQVVRLTRGDYNQQTTYEVDPLDIAKKFQDAGCQWLHIVDLDGAKEGRPVNLAIIENIIKHTNLQVEVGGGIRTEESMEYVLAIVAQRIILGTRALADMPWFEAMAHDARFKNLPANPPGPYVYFVHSYHLVPADPSVIAATADYGTPFVAAIYKDYIMATQFHPEKSQQIGSLILKNFANFNP